jgi:hypothetical protein
MGRQVQISPRSFALPARQWLRAQELHAARRPNPDASLPTRRAGGVAAADAQPPPARRGETSHATLVKAHPKWVDARIRLASLDFENGRFTKPATGASPPCCLPEYSAPTRCSQALESQRFAVDVHRADFEARFDAAPMPSIQASRSVVVNRAPRVHAISSVAPVAP